MATTPIYAGGSRRGAAPRVSQRAAEGVAALGYDEELMRQLLGSFAQTAQTVRPAVQSRTPVTEDVGSFAGMPAVDFAAYRPQLSEALGSGSSVLDFGNLGAGGSGLAAPSGGTKPGMSVGTGLSTLASVLGSVGTLSSNRDLMEVAGGLGTAGAGLSTIDALSRGDTAAAISSGAPLAARALGIPMSAVNLVLSAATGNTAGMINSGISLASPLAAAGNSLLSTATSTALGGDQAVSIGDILTQYGFGRDVFGDVGPIDATQGAKILNALNSQDRLGALMALTGGDNANLPSGAATGAANALSAAQNTNPLDALMQITNAYGTAGSAEESNAQIQNEQLKAIAGELAVEQSRMDTEARVAAEFAAAQAAALESAKAQAAASGVKLPDNFGQGTPEPTFDMTQMPGYLPQLPNLDFSVDTGAINQQLAEQSKWANDYLASQTAGLQNAYQSLLDSLRAEQSANIAVGGYTPNRDTAIDVSFPSSGTSYTYEQLSPYVPSYTAPTYDYSPPSYTTPSSPSYLDSYQLPVYTSPTYSW